MRRVIEVLVLQALIFQGRRDIDQALTVLERAFSFARPEGYVRTFLDEGQQMAELLHLAKARRIEMEYATELLSAMGEATARIQAPVQLDVAASAVARDVRQDRGIEVDLPLGCSVAGRPGQTEPGSSGSPALQCEGGLTVARIQGSVGQALVLEVLQRAAGQHLFAAGKRINRRVAITCVDVDLGRR